MIYIFFISSQILFFFFDTVSVLIQYINFDFSPHSGNSQSTDAATELGLLYLRVGDTQRAFQQFGAALAYSPNCVKAILPMAYVMQVRKFRNNISLLIILKG